MSSPNACAGRTAPYRILLCDDEGGYRALVRVTLDDFAAERGCSIAFTEATNGRDALAAVAEEEPDLVLLDLNMPVLDGYETIPRLRRLAPDATIVALSTAPPEEAEPRVRGLGARAFVQKPRDIFALGDALWASLAAA